MRRTRDGACGLATPADERNTAKSGRGADTTTTHDGQASCKVKQDQRSGQLGKSEAVDYCSHPTARPQAAEKILTEHRAAEPGEWGRITLAVCNTVEGRSTFGQHVRLAAARNCD